MSGWNDKMLILSCTKIDKHIKLSPQINADIIMRIKTKTFLDVFRGIPLVRCIH